MNKNTVRGAYRLLELVAGRQGRGDLYFSLYILFLFECLLWEYSIFQGCQTHFHWGPHQPRSCLQRAKCNFRTV